MKGVRAFLKNETVGDLLPWAAQVAASERFDLSLAQVEEVSLELGLLPARYQRHRDVVTVDGQRRLLRGTVAIIGCGGLGGYLIEELARLGVGRLVAVDPDVFEEHNLNRQLLCTLASIGCSKVSAAQERVAAINPAVRLIPVREAFSRENGPRLLAGVDLALDGLDNLPDRQELARICRHLGIPLVHGAVGGWYGQVSTQLPGEQDSLPFQRCRGVTRGVEAEIGTPAFTPALVASLQVAEACKVLLEEGECLSRRTLFVNLLDMQMEQIPGQD